MKTHCLRRMTGCLFYLLFSIPFYGQQIISKPIPFLGQLSVNSINTIYQDKQGFIWIGTTDGLIRYDGYDIQEFRNNYKNPTQLTSNEVISFAEDADYFWVGTENGINLIDKTSYHIKAHADERISNKSIRNLYADKEGNIWIGTTEGLYVSHSGQIIQKKYLPVTVNSIYEDNNGNIWVLAWYDGIYKYSKESDSFVKYPGIGDKNNPYRLLQDNQNRYWVATWGDGLWRFEPDVGENEMYHKQSVINSTRNYQDHTFFDIVQDDTYGYLWALSLFGLYTLKINEDNELEKVDINRSADVIYPIDKNKLYSRIIKDDNGSLWITAFDESYVISFEKNVIRNYVLDEIKHKVNLDANISTINKDSEGIVWFNQARYGLCLFDEKTNQIVYGDNDNRNSIDAKIIVQSQTQNAMWIGVWTSDEILKISRENMKMSVLERYRLSKFIPNSGHITQILEDKSGNLWVGTTANLFVRPAGVREFLLSPIDIPGVTSLQEGRDGSIWVSCKQFIYQVTCKDRPVLLNKFTEDVTFLKDETISVLCVDQQDDIWFSTSLGRLFRYDRSKQRAFEETSSCGLNGRRIMNLLSDKEKIWIIQNKQLICHDILLKENYLYTVTDNNIQIPLLRHGAAFIDEGGNLYAAGHKGFIKLLPYDNSLSLIKETNRTYITDIKVDNRSILFMPTTKETGNSINQIALTSDSRNIEILFSSLEYRSNQKIRYAYQLEGVDAQWNYIDNGKHSAFYNLLSKGKYTFRVKSTDRYGNWSEQETSLLITRLPAIYETWYAWLLYIIAIFSITFWSVKFYIRRIKEKNRLRFQEELTQVKLNYFTNISHELLTPLTIISCVADDLEENRISSEKQVGILRTNVSRLKRLLQQILDFRKVENSTMPLHVTKDDISSFITTIVASNFQSLARKKKIRLTSQIKKGLWGYMDFDKVDKILFNLLSNAIKYTPEGKQVNLTADVFDKGGYRYLVVQVEDQGIGIENKELKHIFTKFYANKSRPGYESNGIGLSLTKELVTLHHGIIEVSSEVGKGSVFTVEIPVDKEIYDESEIGKVESQPPNEENINAGKPEDSRFCILLVDDNEDLLELMRNVLHNKYRVIIARDGEEAMKILNNNAIDIIICDIMMPLMDGLEFCRLVKQDMQINHIPVLMLTAKNTIEDRIDCYKVGAEGYIAKPFEMKILQARIENLLQAREMRQHSFRSKMSLNISNLDYQTIDEKFLKDAIQCIEQHLNDSDFDIPQMAEKLSISRATLTRKSRAITGLSPLELIRNVKLKHACILLKESTPISEIAYAVGFTSPRYFTQCFKQEFGITPTEYQNREKKDT